MAQAPASLDQLGVPQELRDRAKLMWLITALGGLWGWALFGLIIKLPGQEENQWFKFQAKQNLYVGILGWVLYAIGVGWLVHFIFGILGFLAIGKGQDFEAPVLGKMCR